MVKKNKINLAVVMLGVMALWGGVSTGALAQQAIPITTPQTNHHNPPVQPQPANNSTNLTTYQNSYQQYQRPPAPTNCPRGHSYLPGCGGTVAPIIWRGNNPNPPPRHQPCANPTVNGCGGTVHPVPPNRALGNRGH